MFSAFNSIIKSLFFSWQIYSGWLSSLVHTLITISSQIYPFMHKINKDHFICIFSFATHTQFISIVANIPRKCQRTQREQTKLACFMFAVPMLCTTTVFLAYLCWARLSNNNKWTRFRLLLAWHWCCIICYQLTPLRIMISLGATLCCWWQSSAVGCRRRL